MTLRGGEPPSETPRRGFAALTIGAAGIVFGDIGTSPLYALDQVCFGVGGLPPASADVLGGISLVVWTLTIIVSVKYAIFVLRADNDGEGSIFARIRFRIFMFLRLISRPAYYYYGLGDEVQLSAEIVPVRVR